MLLEDIMSMDKEAAPTWDGMSVVIYSILFMLLLLWWGYAPGPDLSAPHL
jgi:hypothetical protein